MRIEKNLQYYISRFTSDYLSGECGFSGNTVLSYEDTFRLLTRYFEASLGIAPHKIQLDDFNADNIRAFLNHLEAQGCCASTRNQRLAAIKSFCRYVQRDAPKNLYNFQQILKIHGKRQAKTMITYLNANQLAMLLEKPDASCRAGFKDLLMLTVLYDSGARVSEFINIKVSDVRLEPVEGITLHGKGNKKRYVPLSQSTVRLLKLYFEKERLQTPINASRHLFLNRSGNPYTRPGITYILQKYTTMLHNEHPESFPKKLTPHCLRHTKAMVMLRANQDLIKIRDTLGHEHIQTTEIYARADTSQINDAIETLQIQIALPDNTIIDYMANPDLLKYLTELSEE